MGADGLRMEWGCLRAEDQGGRAEGKLVGRPNLGGRWEQANQPVPAQNRADLDNLSA